MNLPIKARQSRGNARQSRANSDDMQAKKCVDSMIPISCAHGMSAQSAVNEAIAQLKASRDRFAVAAGALRASIQQDPIEYKHVSEWIHGCQNLCMGNVTWR
jgi:cytochrome c556